MLIDIQGKVVVITGAGRGIGEGLARRFGAEGTRLVLLERNGESLARVAAEVAQRTDVEAITCDVSQADDVRSAVARAAARFGGIDVLINNAGVAPSATVEDMNLELWEDAFAVNTRGVFLCCQAVIPHMKKRRWGRILNASSFAAIVPSYAFAAYSASKAAVVSFTRVLAAELGPWDITVNSYAPGMIPTAMNRLHEAPAERRAQLLNTLAVRRWGGADDIASLLIFLASSQAEYITGALIDTSGGKFAVQFAQLAYQAAGVDTTLPDGGRDA